MIRRHVLALLAGVPFLGLKEKHHMAKARLDVQLHCATSADATLVFNAVQSALGQTVASEFDRVHDLTILNDTELGVWVVFCDIRFTTAGARDQQVSNALATMQAGGLANRILPTSSVTAYLSHADEGGGGTVDRVEMVQVVK